MKNSLSLKLFLLVFVFLLLLGLSFYQYRRPFPSPTYKVSNYSYQDKTSPALDYPSYGQSAVGAVGYGMLDETANQTSVPTASTAKIITALAVLDKYPIKPGTIGEQLNLDATDVGFYESHYVNDGSVVKVEAGERISEYDALTGMLLPSGNNMADSLARWAFGSQEQYIEYTKTLLAKIGAKNTTVADASGFSSNTTSTASDMTKIALAAMKIPAFAEIVVKPTAEVPVAGKVNNVNWLLGEDGVVGVKTGNTEEAGGCFVFAANRTIDNKNIQVVGTILGAPTRNQAIAQSKLLIRSMDKSFYTATTIKGRQVIGSYTSQLGEKINIVTATKTTRLIWRGSSVNYSFVKNLDPNDKTKVGHLTDASGGSTVEVILDHAPKTPTLWQKMFRF